MIYNNLTTPNNAGVGIVKNLTSEIITHPKRIGVKINYMNSRNYGRLEKAIERSEKPVSYFAEEYGKYVIGAIVILIIGVLYLSHIIKQDAELNWQQVERTENYKVEQIEFYRMVKTNR